MSPERRQSIDGKVQKQLDETVNKFVRVEDWGSDDAGAALHSRWKLIQLVRENSLELETHQLLVSQLPFLEDDIPPYVHSLINQHGDNSIPLIEKLMLRTDLDFGPGEVYRVLYLMAGLATNTSKMLPTPPGVEYSAEKVKYLQLDAPKPLDEEKVARVARKLLDTFEFTESKANRNYESMARGYQEYDVEYSPIVDNVAGLLALAHRTPPFPPVDRRYYWCLAEPGHFFGLNLFYRYLKPSQTEDVLRAILNLADGKGLFLARTRDIPESKAHFQAFR